MFVITRALFVLFAAAAASAFSLGDMDVIFHLYTRSNPQLSQPLFPAVSSIVSSSFDLSRRTIITIHSNSEGVGGNFNAFAVPAHLSAEDVNVLAVDWSPGSSMYSEALGNAPQAGRVIAQFVNILIGNFGYNANQVRIVGVGLGGHIAGIAARHINGVVPHIIALDPSLVGWTHHPEILNRNDARIVEVIHTTAGSKGYDLPLGTIDFYPNGGKFQSGCGSDISCSHTYSYAFYAESLTAEVNNGNRFVGTACDDYESAINLSCSGARNMIFGGSGVKTAGSGIYIFFTNFVPPFARG